MYTQKTLNVILFCCLLLKFQATKAQTDSLRSQLKKTIASVQADVGVSIIDLSTNDTLSVNGLKHLPMQSVFKFHLSLAVLNHVDKGTLKMDQPVKVSRELYYPTHSPIMKKYPEGAELPLREVLWETASWSDNIGCDLLFHLVGGPDAVKNYIHSLGITDVSIVQTEKKMLQEWDYQFKNWTTSNAMAELLKIFYSGKILSKESHDFLWQAMVECPPGPKRLRGMLPTGTVVGNRTGTGGPNEQGIHGAVNDVGIMQLPNGKSIIVAVFVSRSSESFADLEALIARISKNVYDHYTQK